MKYLFTLSVAFFLSVNVAHAQILATTNVCREKIGDEFAAIRDEYRAHVFGARKNVNGRGFSVLTGGYASSEMKGILEMKGRMTSELVQPLVQSYRTMSCKLFQVCSALSDSLYTKEAILQIEVLGCEPVRVPRFAECSLVGDTSISNSYEAAISIQSECESLVRETLAAERAALKVAVAYDSGYRSLLQFSGMMSWMQELLTEHALRPLRDMISLLGRLHQIPCFIGQCDNPVAPK